MLGARAARVTRSLGAVSRAALSTQRIDLGHGGYLNVLLSHAARAKIDVVTTWEDHVEIETNDEKYLDIWVDNQRLEIVDKTDAKEVTLIAKIPQRFNCFIRATQALDLTVGKKLEGDLVVSCQDGTVHLDKVRGTIVHAICVNGAITVADTVEGEISFNAGTINAKLLNGTAVHANAVNQAEISACYSPSAVVVSRTADVKVGTSHGSVLVEAKTKAEVHGVNGSFNVTCDGDISVDVRKLALGSTSKAVSNQGSISMTLDPSITPDKATIAGYDELGQPVELQFGELPTADPSENTRRSSGKISIAEADAQSLDQFVKPSYLSTNNQGYKADQPVEAPQLPAVKLRAQAIQCRYITWKDAIKRKYGLL